MNRSEANKLVACEVMHALFEGEFERADKMFHPAARWWIIGQGEMSHERVRELSDTTEGGATYARLTILGTVAEGNKVAVEAVGDMTLKDGRNYQNTYHHVMEFKNGLIVSAHEYFDTAYVKEKFGENLYQEEEFRER